MLSTYIAMSGLKGVMEEGNEIQFISSVNGYGVTDRIEKLIPNEFVLFRHSSDTQESGQLEREKEWTGGRFLRYIWME